MPHQTPISIIDSWFPEEEDICSPVELDPIMEAALDDMDLVEAIEISFVQELGTMLLVIPPHLNGGVN